MTQFRKKPVVINAVQFNPEQTNQSELLAHLEGCPWQMEGRGIRIPTLEGDHIASPGDWIVKGIKGEFYPVKPDIFVATYEKVAA